jgi:aquaporin Z
MKTSFLRACLAEFIGTFALVFVGTGAIMIDSLTGQIGHIGVAMAFGLVIGVMVYSLGHISGAHFNPAVSIGFLFSKRYEKNQMFFYVLSQITGAVFASGLLLLVFGNVANLGATLPQGGWTQSFVLEIAMTFFLMFVIVSVATDSRVKPEVSGFAIGGAVAMNSLFGGPISGASMNPARSLGPAIIGGIIKFQEIYIVAPVIGSIIAVAAYQFIRKNEKSEPD